MKFECQLCGKFFSEKSTLKFHLRTIHEKVKQFKCLVCEDSFTRKDVLKGNAVKVSDNRMIAFTMITLINYFWPSIEIEIYELEASLLNVDFQTFLKPCVVTHF